MVFPSPYCDAILSFQMSMNANLVKQYEKQDMEHQEMNVHMKDLEHHLNHTQRGEL